MPSTSPLKTHVYIDGFNLYYGQLKSRPYKWLNLEALCDRMLPQNTVEKIYYFTAKVNARPHDPDQPQRQQAYLDALGTLPRVEVHFGNFLASTSRQVVAELDPTTNKPVRPPAERLDATGAPLMEWVLKVEEKGSDVNLAAYLLRDAYRQACECAVVISNDSDLITPVRMAKADCGLVLGLIRPREKGSLELRGACDFDKSIRKIDLSSSQFPDPVQAGQRSIHKPLNW